MTRACVSALARCRDLFWLKQGVTLDTANRRKVVITDASNKGWGALCEDKPTIGLWSEKESEKESILPAGHTGTQCTSMLRQQVHGVIHKSPGAASSRSDCMLVNDLLVWAQNNLISLKVVPGKMNHGEEMLSRNNVSSGEWTLPPLAVQKMWEVWQSSSRPLRRRRQLSLPNLFHKEHCYDLMDYRLVPLLLLLSLFPF